MLAEVAAALGPRVIGSDRELAGDARRALGLPRGRARPRSTCPSTCGWSRAPFRRAVLETLPRGAARRDRQLRRARRARRQPAGRPRGRRRPARATRSRSSCPATACCPARAARQLRRRAGAQARAARARGRALATRLTVTDLMTTGAAGLLGRGSAWTPPILSTTSMALGDLAEQRVVGRQLARPRPVTTKNWMPDVPARLGAGLGHRDDALRVLEVRRRRLDDRVAGAAGAVALRVAALDHEVRRRCGGRSVPSKNLLSARYLNEPPVIGARLASSVISKSPQRRRRPWRRRSWTASSFSFGFVSLPSSLGAGCSTSSQPVGAARRRLGVAASPRRRRVAARRRSPQAASRAGAGEASRTASESGHGGQG